jgi:hypothetical protein
VAAAEDDEAGGDGGAGDGDGVGGGVGGAPASSSDAKAGESLCWVAAAACERCDARTSAEWTSDIILGALGTAALPDDTMRLMSACNRRASLVRN